VAIFILLPFPLTIGIGSLIAFIITMAQPPHVFTSRAKGLLAVFLVLYLGFAVLAAGWLFLVDAYMYRVWLESFEGGWKGEGEGGGSAM
jgi:hypothetical protein